MREPENRTLAFWLTFWISSGRPLSAVNASQKDKRTYSQCGIMPDDNGLMPMAFRPKNASLKFTKRIDLDAEFRAADRQVSFVDRYAFGAAFLFVLCVHVLEYVLWADRNL